jgi:hypothetical protein
LFARKPQGKENIIASTGKYLVGIALQSGEGAPAATPQYRLQCQGSPDIRPATETGRREETGTTRDQGDPIVTQRAVTGGFQVLIRPNSAPLLFYGVTGAKAAALRGVLWAAGVAKSVGDLVRPTATSNKDLFEATVAGTTGTAEPAWPAGIGSTVVDGSVTWMNRGPVQNSHTLTMADDQPWFTIWRYVYGMLAERFEDCKLVSAQTSGGANDNNGDLSATFGVIGKRYSDVTGSIAYDPFDPAAAAGELDTSQPVRWFGYSHTKGGAANTDLDQMQNTINANQEGAKTDQIYFGRVEPTQRTSEHTAQYVFRNLGDYKRAAYGGTGLLTPSDSMAEDEHVYSFVDSGGARRMKLTIPRFIYLGADLPVNASGEMGRIGVAGGPGRPASGSIETVELYNSKASYPAAA